MNIFAKIVKDWKALTIFTKSSILDVWLGSQSAYAFDVNITMFMKSILTPLLQIFAIF